MSRHRILLQTNPTTLKTGLAENAKTLLKYLWKTGRYDIAHYWTQGTSAVDPRLGLTPWKSFGCIPADQNLINQLNSDPHLQRNASYGAYNIDNVIKEWKPTIWIGSDDSWSFPTADYCDKPWYKQINSIHHITIDSIPVLDLAFDQAKKSAHYVTWAKFAALEMKRVRPGLETGHITSIYGAMDVNLFSPISDAEKAGVRKQFGIAPDSFVFLFVGRNQLRKSFVRVMEAFSHFKKDHPNIKAQLYFHTSFSEKGAGWDIPKMAGFYGLSSEDILCTYSCKACGKWWVRPYGGEDIDCPHCAAQKSGITVNIQQGVAAHEMRYVYGISDACVSAFTSGGQEYHNVQSLLCGKPLACTNYSCGEDFCNDVTESFIYPLKYHVYEEMGTNFLKASTDTRDIAAFMRMTARSSRRDLDEIGAKSRAWGIKTFGVEAIGAQWEAMFAKLPIVDWGTITLKGGTDKNENYPMPVGIDNNSEWLKNLYKNILNMDVLDKDDGLVHWLGKLAAGMGRQQIYEYFISVARQENSKNRPPVDFSSILDNTGRKRGLFVIKESIGDIAMCTALFKSFHRQNPNTDLYVATDPKYVEVLSGNEFVYKVIQYLPIMEQELAMIGQGKLNRYFDVYMHPGIQTQRQLDYLSHPEPAFDLKLKEIAP